MQMLDIFAAKEKNQTLIRQEPIYIQKKRNLEEQKVSRDKYSEIDTKPHTVSNDKSVENTHSITGIGCTSKDWRQKIKI